MLTQISIFSRIIFLLLIFSSKITLASGELSYAENGMVVSASELASKIGVEILKRGGNAVDAAVATGFALAVTYPSAGNLGGGGFMVFHLQNGKNTSIDFREVAPISAYKEMFLDKEGNYDPGKSLKGWSSAGVPGSVAGLIYALENYGTMKLEEVIQPAINLAENGFTIDYWLAKSINNFNSEFNQYEASKKIFTDDGKPLEVGDKLIQKELAATLSKIQLSGRDGFYKGEVADFIVSGSESNGGYITHEDLIEYKPVERSPIVSDYFDYEIIGMPPPSAGGIAVAQTLDALEKIEFSKEDFNSSGYVHYFTEILKWVYADRTAYLADPDFVNIPFEYLLSEKKTLEILENISQLAFPSEQIIDANNIFNEGIETTHFSVVDNFGNAVSTTVSINSSYGNKIVVDGAGFLLNNHMDDFTAKVGVKNQFGLVGSERNSIEPGKRMLSSMSPTIVLKNEQPVLILGSPGGSTIITSVLQVIVNVINFGMDIRDAINSPRFHHQWFPDEIVYEEFGLPQDVRINLEKRGHKLRRVEILGRVEGIYLDPEANLIWGSSDKRGFGKAVGY